MAPQAPPLRPMGRPMRDLYWITNRCDKTICTYQHVHDRNGYRRHWESAEPDTRSQAIADAWNNWIAAGRPRRGHHTWIKFAKLLDALTKDIE